MHQRRGTDPAGLGGSTGGSGGSPPEEKQTTVLRLQQRYQSSKFTLNMWVAWNSKTVKVGPDGVAYFLTGVEGLLPYVISIMVISILVFC